MFSVHVEFQDSAVLLVSGGHDKEAPHFEQFFDRLFVKVVFVLDFEGGLVAKNNKKSTKTRDSSRFLQTIRQSGWLTKAGCCKAINHGVRNANYPRFIVAGGFARQPFIPILLPQVARAPPSPVICYALSGNARSSL